MMDLFAVIESAAQSGSMGVNGIQSPTEAQRMAGNYKMGRCEYKGMQLVFEQPRNSFREGVSKDGIRWRNRMAAHYGYIGGTTGADGDGIDIFVGANPESETIYVINQVDKDGSFDEVKAMIGFLNVDDAKRAYQESYDKGWKGLGEIIPTTVDQFKWWLKFGDTTKALSHKSLPYDGSLQMNEIQWDSAALPVGTDLAGVIYALRTDDKDGLLLDSVTIDDILEDAESVLTLDALVVPVVQLDRKMKQLQNIMNMAGTSLEVTAMQITAPFKNRGTTNVAAVYEISDGQTVSVFFHNPDTTPNKLMPTDDLVSWKWMLNKKDITLLVAPEKGQDLNPREVARRVMRLAEKNSERFAKANAKRSERMANISSLKGQVEGKTAALTALEDEIEQVKAKLDDPTRAPVPENTEVDPVGSETADTFNEPAVIGQPESSEPTDMQLAAAGATRQSHELFKELVNLGWENKTADMKSNVVWYVRRMIGGGLKAMMNPEGNRGLVANMEGNMMQAKHGDNVLVSLPYDESKSPAENAQALNDAVTTIDPRATDSQLSDSDEVNFKILGQERFYNNGKTYSWDAGLNRYLSGRGANAAKLKKSDLSDVEVDRFSDLNSLGNVQITDIGGENVYFTKDGIGYYTKLLNTDDWQVGTADFSGVADPYEKQPTTATNPDRDYLNQVIAGQVDVMSAEIADKLTDIAERYAEDTEMQALVEQAAEAYSAAVVGAAKAALGGEPAKKPDAGVANAKDSNYDIANAKSEGEKLTAATGTSTPEKPAKPVDSLASPLESFKNMAYKVAVYPAPSVFNYLQSLYIRAKDDLSKDDYSKYKDYADKLVKWLNSEQARVPAYKASEVKNTNSREKPTMKQLEAARKLKEAVIGRFIQPNSFGGHKLDIPTFKEENLRNMAGDLWFNLVWGDSRADRSSYKIARDGTVTDW